ncbi:stage III sporulation protein AG [Brevibacillus fulvus]|uniref:Stage III sporulation protein AG n=1 Tax=Brevibacillus fulvus TaxID=1125967 RepID=A0A938XUZ5_9BACL|nr:stage III sporulation protein AG [Brevibacillus fulvus]MBM7588579.1 stage III sporulation protein AG [Brevibacillus fulvus]
MFDKWKKWFAQDEATKKLRPIHYFIVLLGVGIAFMILTDFLEVKPDQPPEETSSALAFPGGGEGEPAVPAFGNSAGNDVIAEYENRYETQLKEILEKVIGVGEVEVMVNLDSTPEMIVEKNRDSRSATTQETDKEKATRNQSEQSRNEQVVVIQGKQEQPVVVKTLKPKVRGVLVVAKGAENIQVKAWITEAVNKVLDVPLYKISILPKKG